METTDIGRARKDGGNVCVYRNVCGLLPGLGPLIFRLRDRGSGYYLATGPEGWKMIPPRDRHFAYLIEGPDPDSREVRRGIALVCEFFGENKANGFDLVPEAATPPPQ